MITDPWFYAVAIPAMIVLGLAKGGFGAMGPFVVPLLALVISPIQAAGITLPILVLSDVVALASYWGEFDRRTLFIMLPGTIIGLAIAWATAAWVTEDEIRLIIGLVAILFVLDYWFRRRMQPPRQPNALKGGFWAIVAGFTSFVSHAGGPPYQVYAAPLRLPPRIFAGTSVLLFAIVNALKLVPYFMLGQFDAANLTTSAVLLPISIPATFAGVWLVKRIDTVVFYRVIYALLFVLGVYLVFEALAGMG